MIKKSYIISIVVIVSFLGISATWVISKANESINELPAVIKKVPDFSMTSHIGENFNQDSLLNKISILDFIFTSCPGPCPIMSNNMRTYIDSTNYIQIYNSFQYQSILNTTLKKF